MTIPNDASSRIAINAALEPTLPGPEIGAGAGALSSKPVRLPRSGAASYLSSLLGFAVTSALLARWAIENRGPPYRRISGRCFYEIPDLNAFAAANIGPKRVSSAAG
jgi:hypothetical protein